MRTYYGFDIEMRDGKKIHYDEGEVANWGWSQSGFLYIELRRKYVKDDPNHLETKVETKFFPGPDIKNLEGFVMRKSASDGRNKEEVQEIESRRKALIAGDNNA